ncbi:DEAD-box ATP-dependent RNA helicase FANCM [Coffea eugenioides]|uniref:DEAD-box ATP-dependent RNA helicase FANCM n=1 Tax=Coffea eugenioides TaxID=49369 RepID=UPI000F60C5DE|nr:DEAD-box ATP-dependent RNA helicase FANCM [Coffea eugenioides]
MASSSSTPLHIVDQDNDEFDWEAAVREIDVACAQTTTSSTNYCANNGSNHVINGKIPTYTSSNPRIQETHKKSVPNQSNFAYFASSSRQLTLDRFIGIVPRNSNGHQREKHCNGFLKNKNNNFNSNCQINVGNSGEGQKGQAEDEEENVGFVKIDPEAAKTWIYPVNIPLRDYQLNITRTALFSNTLVALPTGLGKTLIAAVVMYNYFRWFPEGKIVFAAPSRPLVLQQIEACHNVVGIPQEWTIDLTGQTSPTRRADHWRSKRVFFVTPQVLEKDIYSGSCLVKHLVCLVVDEAHRATGNYSYCVAVRELMAVPVQLRVLALTATPGSKQQTIQHVIDNLQISRLEYRSESDPDVIPYVHDRKIELIEVAMGNDAVEINNLILEVIRPYVARLSAIGVLKNRDCQTLSPCDLLNSRDKFREAPPENLPHIKYGEVEGYFGVLITLYHIRKLLSSHGIKPAFEMLAEKLQQGSFARFMSRNEVLLKAKLLMQQSISHGAPSPKLSKLLEVLVDHFKMKDPLESRVIIFSNFRGSVRDIMNALKDIGEFVKATEFVGQTSGKALKGQSQKVQQAVLQKFRAGGYNVIVATSIGEEGLDIMEVDLVICFDANISPLRMIQRMGRTGRKHEGRVVVLACEGSELKGYMRKQANSKAIKKHMRNGGANSFQFHSSPRMIPHVFKPEVQFVELSIEQFVPRVKKVNDDDQPIQSPAYKAKLTDAENDLLSKYFSTTRENTWKPSLIAFPHFQAFPSRVHKVLHSFRTGILIDAMQCLQGLPFSTCSTAVKVEDSASPEPCSASEALEQCNGKIKETSTSGDFPIEDCIREVSLASLEPKEDLRTREDSYALGSQGSQCKNLVHSFLFSSGLISVDDLGTVQVLSVSQFPVKEVLLSKIMTTGRAAPFYHLKQNIACIDASTDVCEERVGNAKDDSMSQIRSSQDDKDCAFKLNSCNASGEKTLGEIILETPIPKPMSDGGESINNSPEDRAPMLFAAEANDDPMDVEFSPRLTNFMESGIVPESPISSSGMPEIQRDDIMVPDLVSTPMVHAQSVVKYLGQNEINVTSSLTNDISAKQMKNSTPASKFRTPTVDECRSPFIKSPDIGFSKDWQLNPGGNSHGVKQRRKFKRLRKHGDLCRVKPQDCKEQTSGPTRNFTSSSVGADDGQNHHHRGAKFISNRAKLFVEDEAEVSLEVMVSSDEEDEQEDNSYEDSFIDDRINPTAKSTQAEESGIDMMAVYRRSLLSQSPLVGVANFSEDFTPSSDVPRNERASTSGSESHLVQKPENGLESTARNSASLHFNLDRVSSDALLSRITTSPKEQKSKMENRKRKLFCKSGFLPVHNLEKEFFIGSVASGHDSMLHEQTDKIQENSKTFLDNDITENRNIFDDDQFYNAIDLDAIEEQAAKLIGFKTDYSKQNQVPIAEPVPVNPSLLGSPSFDLGI